METTRSWEPGPWAQEEFGGCELGDVRRTKRVVKIAAACARGCEGTLPSAITGWGDLKAAYRLLNTQEVTGAGLREPHLAQTRARAGVPGEYLLIEDTTDLNLTRAQPIAGLGWTGNEEEQGLLVHTTLAARVTRGTAAEEAEVELLGLFDQQVWSRHHRSRKGRETREARQGRPRESERWARALTRGGPPAGVRWTYVADRESDIFEVLARCRRAGCDWIVRACWPRRVVGATEDVLTLARTAPVRGRLTLALRSRPGVAARTAQLTLRSQAMSLRGPHRPTGRPAPETVNVVAVVEEQPPPRVAPLHWVLLTTWPVATGPQCVRVVQTYSQRWLIEEYHKALKTGVGLEHTQLESAHAIEALLGILSVVAARLLQLKLVARADPTRALAPDELPAAALALLAPPQGAPPGGWTYLTAITALAQLGGFLARKGDGPPGWLTLWRGWQRLSAMMEGYRLAGACGKCG